MRSRFRFACVALASTDGLRYTEGVLSDAFRREWVDRLFGGARYEFGFGMRRGRDDHWFRWDDWDDDAVNERRQWLTNTLDACCVWTPDAEPLLDEAIRLFPAMGAPNCSGKVGRDLALELARVWEPDWLLLRRDPDGEYRLKGAVVCFPSSWDVREKLGRTVTDVHSIVPTLNATLGDRIRSFLSKMPDAGVFERENWGLAATGERNAHPDRQLPRLGADATLDRTWLRLEHQSFRSLPRVDGLLFALRIEVIRLDELLTDHIAKGDFARMVVTMPPEVAAYKGLESARGSLLAECAEYR